ncbi:MAG TPA: hypothetical protein VM431_13265 [Phycisphaerae bacterium]|nr:hypothetical protein [Phycisphaerae bacterium]
MEHVRLANGVSLNLVTEGEALLGIGEVRAGGVALRSGRRPMFVEIRTPDARRLCDWRIEHREASDAGLRLALAA